MRYLKEFNTTSQEDLLIYACNQNDLKAVKALINNDVDPNSLNSTGEGALHEASQKGHLDIVKYLIESGADVNFLDKKGRTALIYASVRGHIDIVKYLVDLGADVMINTDDGNDWTAADVAMNSGHFNIFTYLITHPDMFNYIDTLLAMLNKGAMQYSTTFDSEKNLMTRYKTYMQELDHEMTHEDRLELIKML